VTEFTEAMTMLDPVEKVECIEDAIAELTGLLLATLKAMPYEAYLETAHWKYARVKAIDRAGGSCQLCNERGDLDVHHRTYERRGHEKPGDLIVLCRDCHGRFHGVLLEAA
jgi:hypothetical protein